MEQIGDGMLCKICEMNEIKNPDQDVCFICHLSGREFESYLLSDLRSNLLSRINNIEGVTTAAVLHLGQSMFQLGIMLDSGTLLIPGWGMEIEDNVVVQPGIPTVDGKWVIVKTNPLETPEGWVDQVDVQEELLDDEELIERVEELAAGVV